MYGRSVGDIAELRHPASSASVRWIIMHSALSATQLNCERQRQRCDPPHDIKLQRCSQEPGDMLLNRNQCLPSGLDSVSSRPNCLIIEDNPPAPASTNSFASFMFVVGPPCPDFPSAIMGINLSTFIPGVDSPRSRRIEEIRVCIIWDSNSWRTFLGTVSYGESAIPSSDI